MGGSPWNDEKDEMEKGVTRDKSSPKRPKNWTQSGFDTWMNEQTEGRVKMILGLQAIATLAVLVWMETDPDTRIRLLGRIGGVILLVSVSDEHVLGPVSYSVQVCIGSYD